MDMKRILQAMDGVATKPVVGANDMKKFLSVVTEGANPHKVALPVQMVMQHYQQPKVEPVAVANTTSLLKQYFQETEDAVAEQIAKEEAIRQQRVRMYSQKIAERVLMKESQVTEMSIELDKNDPLQSKLNHKSNPGTIEYRIMRARSQIKDLATRVDSNELIVWEAITRQFPELAMNIEEIRHGIEELAKIRKGGGRRVHNIDKHIGEDNDPCWKDYKQIGMKKKGGKSVPNCVPKK